ncbi:MFS transporter [Opitutaceae bacterium TAV4]|nr:MFS transporter [Opitutaceae bacterium TAV4]RRJ99498.1 MFS transporter [Opitutaceae bacterium TAV3]
MRIITPPPQTSSRMPGKSWKVGTLTYTSGGLVVLFCWLLFGDFAWSMRDRSVGPMAQWFLNRLNVSNLLFGLLISSFPALVGVLLGPVISVKSDRHRGKWGRRIPFLIVTTPIAAFGMIGIAVTPIISQWVRGHFPEQSEMLVGVVCFGIFWAAFEFATITGNAVFGGLINDVVPKELLGRFYGLFRAVSLIDGMIFNYWIMGKVPEHFTLILCLIGVFYGAAFMWVCFKVKEGDYPPPPAPVAGNQFGGVGRLRQFFHETRRYLKECFTNPYYLSVFVLLKISVMAFGPINIFAIPYARSLGVNMDTYGKFLALTYLISLSLSFFLGWMADAFHPLRMAIGTLLGYLVVMILGGLYATTPNSFLAVWVAHGVLSGCYLTSAASLGQRLFPHAKYAQFASAASVCTAFASMALAPAMGLLIDGSGGVFRYTFAVGGVFAVLALIAGFYVHAKFMKLGGPKGYVAPE